MPVIVSGLLASVFTGHLLGPANFTGPAVMTISLIAFTTGMVIFATAPVDQIYWAQTFVSIAVVRELGLFLCPFEVLDSPVGHPSPRQASSRLQMIITM